MLITLKQNEIEDALRLYIETNGILVTGKTVNFAFTAGRTPAGLSVEVDIVNATLAGSSAVATGKVTQAAPKVAANEPQPEPAPETPKVEVAEIPAPVAEAPAGKSLFG